MAVREKGVNFANVKLKKEKRMGSPMFFHDKAPVFKNRALEVWLRDIQKYKVLSVQEEEDVIRRYKEGDRSALDILIQSNQRFVYKMAKTFSKDADTILELISEGNLALFDAVDRFDLTRGYKFMSYAVWFIKRNMLEYFYHDGLVNHYISRDIMCRANRIKRKWLQENGYDIPLDILRDKVNEEQPLRAIRDKMFFADITIKYDGDYCETNESEECSLINTVQPSMNKCEEVFEREDEMKRVEYYLDAVCNNDIEKNIMIDKYGLFGNEQLGEASLCMKYGIESWYIGYLNLRIMRAMNQFAKTGTVPKKRKTKVGSRIEENLKGGKKGVSVSAKAQVSVKKKEKTTPKRKTKSACGS